MTATEWAMERTKEVTLLKVLTVLKEKGAEAAIAYIEQELKK